MASPSLSKQQPIIVPPNKGYYPLVVFVDSTTGEKSYLPERLKKTMQMVETDEDNEFFPKGENIVVWSGATSELTACMIGKQVLLEVVPEQDSPYSTCRRVLCVMGRLEEVSYHVPAFGDYVDSYKFLLEGKTYVYNTY